MTRKTKEQPKFLDQVRLFCFTWNVGATRPIQEESLEHVLRTEEPNADVVCLGFQEVCQLTARRLIADGQDWLDWRMWAEQGVEKAYAGQLELLSCNHLVGLLIIVFVRKSLMEYVSRPMTCEVATGVGGVGGNKGAVCARMDIGGTSVCFVNAHLAAGQEHYIERCQDYNTIIQKIRFVGGDMGDLDEDPTMSRTFHVGTPPSQRLKSRRNSDVCLRETGGFSATMFGASDHDFTVWIGDTNSRLHWPSKLGGMPINQAMEKVRDRRIGELLLLDQLNLMRRDGHAFDGFEEHRIFFLPSYKWRPHGDALDMRSQKHVPAWTDRILFRSLTRPRLEVHRYDMYPDLKQSDHRPVFACISLPWRTGGTLGRSSSNITLALRTSLNAHKSISRTSDRTSMNIHKSLTRTSDLY